ncbi:hypothetical protein [Nitrosomonas sp. Nm33]|nr:hypothetical protein [Nitrosomonas sp. Nm33]
MLNFDYSVEHPAMFSAQLAIRVLRAYYWRQKGRYRVIPICIEK